MNGLIKEFSLILNSVNELQANGNKRKHFDISNNNVQCTLTGVWLWLDPRSFQLMYQIQNIVDVEQWAEKKNSFVTLCHDFLHFFGFLSAFQLQLNTKFNAIILENSARFRLLLLSFG